VESVYIFALPINNNMTTIISKKGDNTKVVGQFFVTYKAQRVWNGIAQKPYTTTHLMPSETNLASTCDEINNRWQEKYKGKCPFNGDVNFEVLQIQQRYN
jgi:hypothetical protein